MLDADPNPPGSSRPLDSFGTLCSTPDGWEAPKDDSREFLLPTSLRFLLAERDVSYRMVSVHHSKEQAETIFKLVAEGMFRTFILIHDRLTELWVLR